MLTILKSKTFAGSYVINNGNQNEQQTNPSGQPPELYQHIY